MCSMQPQFRSLEQANAFGISRLHRLPDPLSKMLDLDSQGLWKSPVFRYMSCMEVSINGGSPIAGWFIMENHGKSIYKWITRGASISIRGRRVALFWIHWQSALATALSRRWLSTCLAVRRRSNGTFVNGNALRKSSVLKWQCVKTLYPWWTSK